MSDLLVVLITVGILTVLIVRCRYIVRVVSTHEVTKVDWVTANSATKGSRQLSRGHYFDIENPLASQPMKVECDQPCLVMLYNTGKYIHEYR